VKLFVLDPHAIYRRGLVACLTTMPEVEAVDHEGSVRAARERQGHQDEDHVHVDPNLEGGHEIIDEVSASVGAELIFCSSDCDEASVKAAIAAGAVGYLRKETLTTEALASAVQAVASGTGVMTPELLGALLKGLDGNGRPAAAQLTDREQQVLALIAAGHPTREVAEELCYSERTVKNVLHDIVTKLNARSRSQAVAFAVREGLI
jgi:DNA-binding NarL/FixJ family response regulator